MGKGQLQEVQGGYRAAIMGTGQVQGSYNRYRLDRGQLQWVQSRYRAATTGTGWLNYSYKGTGWVHRSYKGYILGTGKLDIPVDADCSSKCCSVVIAEFCIVDF